MDDWTYPHPDADSPRQLALRDQDWRTIEGRRGRARQTEAAGVADLEQTQALDAVGDPHPDADGLPPLATPSGAGPTF